MEPLRHPEKISRRPDSVYGNGQTFILPPSLARVSCKKRPPEGHGRRTRVPWSIPKEGIPRIPEHAGSQGGGWGLGVSPPDPGLLAPLLSRRAAPVPASAARDSVLRVTVREKPARMRMGAFLSRRRKDGGKPPCFLVQPAPLMGRSAPLLAEGRGTRPLGFAGQAGTSHAAPVPVPSLPQVGCGAGPGIGTRSGKRCSGGKPWFSGFCSLIKANVMKANPNPCHPGFYS
jgi:hypothetical protein